METIIKKCPAKINISLDIVGKKENGYHLLETIMQSVELFDEVRINKTDKGIKLVCNKENVPCDASNTAYRAASLVMEKYGIQHGVQIIIEKRIPIAAGLAGGSTDAAGVIKAMNELFDLNMSTKEMMDIGVMVGADVPFCILQHTALAEGIGEKLTPLSPVKDVWCLLAKPDISISTQWVYSRIKLGEIANHPDTSSLRKYIEKGDIENLARNMVNVLEGVTIKENSIISNIKKTMLEYHALGSMMSGSGPTVFGLFNDKNSAEECYCELIKSLKEVYLVKTYNNSECTI